MRWINEALQYARYKQPAAGLPVMKIVDLSEETVQKKISSTSSHLDCLPSPPPSPEMETNKRKTMSGKEKYLNSLQLKQHNPPFASNLNVHGNHRL